MLLHFYTESSLNAAALREAGWFSASRARVRILLQQILLIFFGYALGMLLFLLWCGGKEIPSSYLLLLILIGIFGVARILALIFPVPGESARLYEQGAIARCGKPAMCTQTQFFDRFFVHRNLDTGDEICVEYCQIKRIKETAHFYILNSLNTLFFLSKAGFSIGDTEAFLPFLREQMQNTEPAPDFEKEEANDALYRFRFALNAANARKTARYLITKREVAQCSAWILCFLALPVMIYFIFKGTEYVTLATVLTAVFSAMRIGYILLSYAQGELLRMKQLRRECGKKEVQQEGTFYPEQFLWRTVQARVKDSVSYSGLQILATRTVGIVLRVNGSPYYVPADAFEVGNLEDFLTFLKEKGVKQAE